MGEITKHAEQCPYCGNLISAVKPVPEIDNGESVCVVGNKREIASLMNKTEFEDFCRIWQETQKEFGVTL